MAKNYKIVFKSLRTGITYTVHIGGGTGAEVELKGGASPFMTQEDDNEDMFTPIRTQSGYLRVLDDGFAADGVTAFDWKDLIPSKGTERPVTLDAGNTTVWQGFLQPQSFSGTLYIKTQEREFPIMCMISALPGFDISPSEGTIKNFGWLLYYIFGRIGQWSYFYFQGGNAKEWLSKDISWYNLIEIGSDNIARSKYDCYQILEDICLFWGWTVRTHGTSVWFTSADDNAINWKFQRTDYRSLEDVGSAVFSDVSWGEFDVLDFVSIDNNEVFILGFHKVTVSADINKQDNILEIPMSQIAELFDGKTVSHTSQGNIHTFIVNYYPTSYENNILAIDCYSDQSNIRGRFTASEVYEGDISDKHNYNFTYSLDCYGLNVPYDEYCFRLISKYPLNYSVGAITINGEIDMRGDQYTDNSGYIVCALKVGNKWWSGSAWTTTRASFQIPIVGGKIADNRSLNGLYVSYKGFGISVQGLGGMLEFYCLGSHSTGTIEGEFCKVKGLQFGFARINTSAPNNSRTKNEYTQTNNSQFPEEKSVELIYASDDGNAPGYGIIFDHNGGYTSLVQYSGQSSSNYEHPEQHLANRMASFFSTKRHKTSVELDTDRLGNVTPGDMSANSQYPIAISHEWRDDVTQLTLIDL